MSRNVLSEETSPYLLQHADNPVHWQPWGPEALARARAENRPILLSVGYAACHWCHVMAHESFEDEAIAALMNQHFVNVKVDREERPDIDTIYMHALHMMGQQGGWPLTMFLTPDGEPFWGGTYFPPESRFGRPGFPEVLEGLAKVYRETPDKVADAAASLRGRIAEMATSRTGDPIPTAVNDQAAARIAAQYDKVEGGIGTAPKFPNPSTLELLWRAYLRNGDPEARGAVLLSLEKMSQGGIYDHLGGGYARYATDARWLVPHFEKMLYDNAQLVDLLVAAWKQTRSPLFEARIRETVDWIDREMIAEGGGFAATLDADSEGVEGKFYVWTEAEIDQALGAGASLFKWAYDVRPGGNWEGRTILNRNHAAGPFSPDDEQALARGRAELLRLRGARIRPGWDDKVLADWNGLMIAALANASAVFEAPEWVATAVGAFNFVAETMQVSGRLAHACRAGRVRHAATLDDYAAMARGALALHEVTGEERYLAAARGWVDVLDAHYLDEAGGYFLTADDAEALIVRTKSADDNATPSGNGMIADVLARLFLLTGEDGYRARAEALITAFSGEVSQNFYPLATLLNASEMLQQGTQIAIIGAPDAAPTRALARAAHLAPVAARVIAVFAPDEALPAGHPAAGKGLVEGAPAAYVCVGPTCSLPQTTPAGLTASLRPNIEGN